MVSFDDLAFSFSPYKQSQNIFDFVCGPSHPRKALDDGVDGKVLSWGANCVQKIQGISARLMVDDKNLGTLTYVGPALSQWKNIFCAHNLDMTHILFSL